AELPSADSRARVAAFLPFLALLPQVADAAPSVAVSAAPSATSQIVTAVEAPVSTMSTVSAQLGVFAQLKVALVSAGISALVVAGAAGTVRLSGDAPAPTDSVSTAKAGPAQAAPLATPVASQEALGSIEAPADEAVLDDASPTVLEPAEVVTRPRM